MENIFEEIIYYGTLAPSAHNTQPWSFKLNGDIIEIYLNQKRVLKHSDPNKWETLLSLGACLTNLEEAAKAFGIYDRTKLFPKTLESDLIAHIVLKSTSKPNNTEVLNVIAKRQTNRSRYLPRAIPSEMITNWEELINDSVQGIFISEKEIIKKIAQVHYEATVTAFSDNKFRKELSQWVRNSLTHQSDGMPGYATNIPLPLSFIGSWLIKHVNIGKMQASMEKSLILSTPLLMILTVKKSTKEELVIAGQVFEKIALDITAKGLVYAPLGAVTEDPIAATKLKELLGIIDTPVMLIRIGYSNKKYKYSPKRSVAEVLEN